MDKLKTIVDREPISSESIAERQNFNDVLQKYKAQPAYTGYNKWIYGSVIGSAVVAGVVISTSLNWDAEPPLKKEAVVNPSKKDVTNIISAKSTGNSIQLAVTNTVEKQSLKPAKKTEAVKRKPVLTESTEEPVKEIAREVEQEAKTVEVIPVKTEKKPVENNMPHIGAYYFGEVPLNLLCDNEKISSGNNLAVVSYTIAYFNGNVEVEEKIRGAKIPENVCEKLGKFNVGSDIRITSIVAEDRFSGVQYQLPSMSITPVLSE